MNTTGRLVLVVLALVETVKPSSLAFGYRIGDRVGVTFQARQSSRRGDSSGKDDVSATKTHTSLEPMQHQVPHFGMDAVNLTVPLRMLAAEIQQYTGATGSRVQVDAVSMVVGDYFSLPWTDVMYSNPEEEVTKFNHQTQSLESRPARYVLESLTVAFVYSRGDFGGGGGEIHSVFVYHHSGQGPVYRKLTKEEEDDTNRRGHSALARATFRLHYKWIEEPSVDQESAVGMAFMLCVLSTLLLFSLACRDMMVWTSTIDDEQTTDEYHAPQRRQGLVHDPLQPESYQPYRQRSRLGPIPFSQHQQHPFVHSAPTTVPMSRTFHKKDKV